VKGNKRGRFGILAGLRRALLAAVSYTSEERSLDCARDDGERQRAGRDAGGTRGGERFLGCACLRQVGWG
jgi:hypothetical protein